MGRRFRLAQFLGQHAYLPRRLIEAARSGENPGPPLPAHIPRSSEGMSTGKRAGGAIDTDRT